MKGIVRFFLFFVVIWHCVCAPVYASAYHQFFNLAYDNPAALNSIKGSEAIIGDTFLNPTFHFKGSDGPYVGTTTSDENINYVYGRVAHRINPDWVASLDISHLVTTDIEYPIGSVLQNSSTATILKDINFAPKVSYQATPALSVGVGINANYLRTATLNFIVPPDELVTHGSDWAYGWMAGLNYVMTPKTFINLSYSSKVLHNPKGKSSWGGLVNSNYTVNVPIPAVSILNVTQILTDKWLVSASIRYVEWSLFKRLTLKNTALGDITTKQGYKNIFNYILLAHYQINNSWGVLAGGEYDANPQPTAYRSPGLPTYSVGAFFVGGEYIINKNVTTKLVYAHAISRPPINTMGPIGPTIGRENINADLVDLSFVWTL